MIQTNDDGRIIGNINLEGFQNSIDMRLLEYPLVIHWIGEKALEQTPCP